MTKVLFIFFLLLLTVTSVFLSQKKDSPEPAKTVIEAASDFTAFGTVSVVPDFFLEGSASTIEAPEFFEHERPEDTLLFVSGKSSDSLEIWTFPFRDTKDRLYTLESSPNGLAIDQENDLLFIAKTDKKVVETVKLPDLSRQRVIGEGVLKSGENNLGVFTLRDGKKRLYATDNNHVSGFALDGTLETRFSPQVEGIEEVLGDNFHQIIYVPDEKGGGSDKNPGGVILAFHPDGTPYEKEGKNRFGEGLYSGDSEGIELYRCLDALGQDSGRGFIVSVDQNEMAENGLEFFDRETWKHLGTLRLEGVMETDGIDTHERPLPDYPLGLLATSNNDLSVALTSWDKIATATGLKC